MGGVCLGVFVGVDVGVGVGDRDECRAGSRK